MNAQTQGGATDTYGCDYPVVVVGLGHTGLSCARLLRREGVSFAITDTRAAPPCVAQVRREMPEVPLHLGGLDGTLLNNAEQLVLSPGLHPGLPELERAHGRGVEFLGDIALFRLRARAPIAAVTGSNGKSTVATLLAEMARRAGRRVGLGGNIGRPALDLLQGNYDLYVLEVSSFQLETVRDFNVAAAAVLNVVPEHLDRYADIEAYAAAKERIYAGCRHMVVNLDDARVCRMRPPEDAQVHGYTVRDVAGMDGYGLVQTAGGAFLAHGGRALMPLSALHVPGLHYAGNCLAALSMGKALGLDEKVMLEAIAEFGGLEHRLQRVCRRNGVDWYNDSKATNVAAACAALSALGDPARGVVLIAGGEAKENDDYASLVENSQGRLRAVVLLGRDAPLLERWLTHTAPVAQARDMQHAVSLAARLAHSGDAVLLSPACASFDMYVDYRERGQAFVAALENLPGAVEDTQP